MELATQINKFIENPFPLWETTLTQQLVQHKWKELESKGFKSSNDYSTARVWLNDPYLELGKKKEVAKNLFVETPLPQLQSFYDEHGLELLTEHEIEADVALLKLKKAISILQLIEPVYDCITNLVKSIQVLRQQDVETDLSYSHPDIPFSIFVSVCEDDSEISSLRIAESILHEAMHLKLTLIENIVPLVKPDAGLYYSPWKDEERPVRGVLHGLFVFRAIYEFYNKLYMYMSNELNNACKYFNNREKQLENEISSTKKFPQNSGLTQYGAILAKNLLP